VGECTSLFICKKDSSGWATFLAWRASSSAHAAPTVSALTTGVVLSALAGTHSGSPPQPFSFIRGAQMSAGCCESGERAERDVYWCYYCCMMEDPAQDNRVKSHLAPPLGLPSPPAPSPPPAPPPAHTQIWEGDKLNVLDHWREEPPPMHR